MADGAKRLISRCVGARVLLPGALSLFLCLRLGLCQDSPQSNNATPKYDLKAETKIEGTLEEVKLFDFGARKDFVEVIVKSSEGDVTVYMCPKPYEDELGITLHKGDAIAFTGSKVKQKESDVILAKELVKGQDTLMFRDSKGNPVWDWRTGK